MIRIKSVTSLILALLLYHVQAVADTRLGMHLVQIFNEGVYSLDISYDSTFSAQLRISCIDKCQNDTSYSETIGGFSLLGAYGDGDMFITLWSAGSVDWLIIYRIYDGVVTKVLRQPSRTSPDFEFSPDGRRVIVLHNDSPGMYIGKELYGNPPGLTKTDREKIRSETTSFWIWNGITYVPYHGKVLGGWETIK